MRMGLAWLLAAWTLAASVGSAQSPEVSEADDRRARIHFESGRQYFDEGEYERAVEEFTRAYELSHRSELLMNVANGLERLARYGDAADRMQRYLDESEGDTVPARDVLARRIENLRDRQARADAEAAAAREAEIAETTEPDPGTEAPRVTEPPATPPERTSSHGRALGAAISFGVAGAGLVTFAVLGGMALGERSSVEDGCGATRSCSSSDVSRMDGLALGADLGLAIGVAGAVAGVLVLVLKKDGPSEDARARTTFTPWAARNGGGAMLRGAF